MAFTLQLSLFYLGLERTEASRGVLIANLGTPDAPTRKAVRRYLKQFLWDPRVVELPRPLWWLILNGIILTVRPSRSAEAYEKIWTEQGSPLLLFSQDIADGIGRQLAARTSGPVHVELGMSYGQPSIEAALQRQPDYLPAQWFIANVYVTLGRDDEAAVYLTTLLEADGVPEQIVENARTLLAQIGGSP